MCSKIRASIKVREISRQETDSVFSRYNVADIADASDRASSQSMDVVSAGVAELADAPALGAGDRKVLGVQIPPPAPISFTLKSQLSGLSPSRVL